MTFAASPLHDPCIPYCFSRIGWKIRMKQTEYQWASILFCLPTWDFRGAWKHEPVMMKGTESSSFSAPTVWLFAQGTSHDKSIQDYMWAGRGLKYGFLYVYWDWETLVQIPALPWNSLGNLRLATHIQPIHPDRAILRIKWRRGERTT